uniref:G_PROTEIN_RECEP_F1_2 domain-containing protein n=1 Tax=Caenorhabditis tropicalis TaxID=1561998 RepID=A0A1I7U065_9PELO
MESDSPLNHPVVHFLLCVSYLFVFLATIIGNLIILLVFFSQKKVRSVPNFFLANLTVADLFVGIFCVLQNAVNFVFQGHGRWPFGKVLCYSYIYVLHFIPNVSAGILVLVSVERLIAVLRPLRVRRAFSQKVLITSSAVVWLTSAVMNTPYVVASQFLEISDGNETYTVCEKTKIGTQMTLVIQICTRRHVEIYGFNLLKLVATINFIVWYAVPLVILLCIYATIGLVVSKAATITKHSANKLLPRSSWRSEASTGGVSVEKRRKVGRLAVGIVVAFAFFSLPRYVYFMWTVWRDPMAPRCLNCLQSVLQPISFLLLFFNAAVDPFLYAFLSTRFRQSIKETFHLGKVRESNIELSSRLRRKVVNSELETGYEYHTHS